MTDSHTFLLTLKEILQTALISFGLFLFIYIFLVQPHRVQGTSMLPNFENGELLLTEKISYRFSDPKVGDVIVFEAPIGRKVDFIKRIIGLPGDTVKIEEEKVIVNGKELKEPNITSITEGNKTVKLKTEEYFVLGDNRTSSSDSRSFGPVKGKLLRGKVWLVYWPLIKSSTSGGARLISNVNNSVTN